MSKRNILSPMTFGLSVALTLSSLNGSAQETHHQQQGHGHSRHAFSDRNAIAQMAANFESAERDSMQQPNKVIRFLGDIRGKKIMDIGAATGYFSVKFAAMGAQVIAADVSEEFQAYLKQRIEKEKISNIELRRVPYDSPSLKDREADIVFVANTYHHIENRVEYFKKVKHGLKPDGELVILDYFKAIFTDKIQAPEMAMRASIDEVVFELRKAGYSSFEVEVNLLPYQYIIKAK